MKRGPKPGCRKLTAEDIAEIQRMYRQPGVHGLTLARLFRVSETTIHKAVDGKLVPRKILKIQACYTADSMYLFALQSDPAQIPKPGFWYDQIDDDGKPMKYLDTQATKTIRSWNRYGHRGILLRAVPLNTPSPTEK